MDEMKSIHTMDYCSAIKRPGILMRAIKDYGKVIRHKNHTLLDALVGPAAWHSGVRLGFQLLRRLKQEDCLSPGAGDQPKQHSKTSP
jgi:hypothetical protein